tara:strand:+ start:5302 stop:6585 length:1284 start_codon:yes stop_codon:yes gene_type:complete
MSGNKEARKLIHTERGNMWLNQFEPLDQEIASSLANNLTLVSHNEFERNLTLKMAQVAECVSGPIAFFAMREMVPHKPVVKGKKIQIEAYDSTPYYQQVQAADDGVSVTPLGNTADIGSEGRVASIIRQFCKRDKNKYLNHPTLEYLRATKCRAIVCVDDFIGSGNRALEFLDAFWMEKSIVSWHSYKLIHFHVIAYSGVDSGIELLRSHKSSPFVHVYRDAPTFNSLPWSNEKKEELLNLCEKYGRKANKKRKHMWFGYKKTMCALVFEHGCPNNVPAILVEDSNKWIGLFPDRTIVDTTLSVFPGEIPQRANIKSLYDIGQQKLARSPKLIRRGEVGKALLVILALISKGKRKRSTLCYATGLSNYDCDKYLEKCIEWKFVSPQKRITPAGLAELRAAKKIGKVKSKGLEKGSDYYYPIELRGTT